MRQDLNMKLVSSVKSLLRCPSHTHSCRGSRNNDGASGQSGALRKEGNELGNPKYQVTAIRH